MKQSEPKKFNYAKTVYHIALYLTYYLIINIRGKWDYFTKRNSNLYLSNISYVDNFLSQRSCLIMERIKSNKYLVGHH